MALDHGFDPDPSKVRADWFTGDSRLKWKYTDALPMRGYFDQLSVYDAVGLAWERLGRYRGLVLVVLDPYHRNSYPVMIGRHQHHIILEDLRFRLGETEVTRLLALPAEP